MGFLCFSYLILIRSKTIYADVTSAVASEKMYRVTVFYPVS